MFRWCQLLVEKNRPFRATGTDDADDADDQAANESAALRFAPIDFLDVIYLQVRPCVFPVLLFSLNARRSACEQRPIDNASSRFVGCSQRGPAFDRAGRGGTAQMFASAFGMSLEAVVARVERVRRAFARDLSRQRKERRFTALPIAASSTARAQTRRRHRRRIRCARLGVEASDAVAFGLGLFFKSSRSPLLCLRPVTSTMSFSALNSCKSVLARLNRARRRLRVIARRFSLARCSCCRRRCAHSSRWRWFALSSAWPPRVTVFAVQCVEMNWLCVLVGDSSSGKTSLVSRREQRRVTAAQRTAPRFARWRRSRNAYW